MENPYGVEALWSQGDMVIKVVAMMLLAMSIASWYVIVIRSLAFISFAQADSRAGGFLARPEFC